ncbi:MAG: triose-phosphate isomerase [Deltaproteobacteria bacterium]|nr:triose-phosphate isomerase [Deltaproteobacteria bacterium]
MIAGNWKMNLNLDESANLVKAIAEEIQGLDGVDVLVAPPFTSLPAAKQAIGDARILLAAQNMYWEPDGAYTGEISGQMLVEAGCSHVILGHSERRSLFGESSEMVDLKVKAAMLMGLIPIICIGETLEAREAGRTFEVVKEQLEGSLKNFIDEHSMPPSTILAYEPVWAIGTGKTATPEQAQEVHHFIRQWIEERFDKDTADLVRILYGGSVKPDNAKDLMSRQDIDGALVGGASLKADLFVPIIKYQES